MGGGLADWLEPPRLVPLLLEELLLSPELKSPSQVLEAYQASPTRASESPWGRRP